MLNSFDLFKAFKEYLLSCLTIILTPCIAFSQFCMITKYPSITPSLPLPEAANSSIPGDYGKINLSTPWKSNKEYFFSFLIVILTSSLAFNQFFNTTIIHSLCPHITPSTPLYTFLSLLLLLLYLSPYSRDSDSDSCRNIINRPLSQLKVKKEV
jgi:hypothetical protein